MKKILFLILSMVLVLSMCLTFTGCMDKETKAAIEAFDQEVNRISEEMDALNEEIDAAESDLAAGNKAEPKIEEALQAAINEAKEAENEITIPDIPDDPEADAINAETKSLKEITLTEQKYKVQSARDKLHYSWEEFSLGDYDGSLGSAGEITDDTVIVSIFANDKDYRWTDSAEDTETKNDCLDRLSQATSYLENEVVKFIGDDAESPHFYYNWHEDEELYHAATFDTSFSKSWSINYNSVVSYIKENIDPVALKKKYDAENILYMVFINTDDRNSKTARTLSWDTVSDTSDDKVAFMPEITIVFYTDTYRDGSSYITYPQSYAHEIMHAFGAEDFYMTGNRINRSYVDYCQENKVKDIMNRIDDWYPFTEIDAYYLGLTEHSADVEEYNLGESEHFEDNEN